MLTNYFLEYAQRRSYWLLLFIFALSLETTALIYQHVLDYPPCIVCIHVRILTLLLMLIALAGVFAARRRVANMSCHVLVAIVSAAMIDRAWQLLGTERGFIFGSCDFSLGFPKWFDIERWLPSVFEVQTSCGYTPELFLGITMAESLLVISVLLLILSLAFLAALVLKK